MRISTQCFVCSAAINVLHSVAEYSSNANGNWLNSCATLPTGLIEDLTVEDVLEALLLCSITVVSSQASDRNPISRCASSLDATRGTTVIAASGPSRRANAMTRSANFAALPRSGS